MYELYVNIPHPGSGPAINHLNRDALRYRICHRSLSHWRNPACQEYLHFCDEALQYEMCRCDLYQAISCAILGIPLAFRRMSTAISLLTALVHFITTHMASPSDYDIGY